MTRNANPGSARTPAWCILVVATGLAAACDPAGREVPELRHDERVLVDLYVQIALLEQEHTLRPDSAEAGFRRLAAARDSAAVRRALAGLEAEPRRWEAVYEAIARRLRELEEDAGRERPAPPEMD